MGAWELMPSATASVLRVPRTSPLLPPLARALLPPARALPPLAWRALLQLPPPPPVAAVAVSVDRVRMRELVAPCCKQRVDSRCTSTIDGAGGASSGGAPLCLPRLLLLLLLPLLRKDRAERTPYALSRCIWSRATHARTFPEALIRSSSTVTTAPGSS